MGRQDIVTLNMAKVNCPVCKSENVVFCGLTKDSKDNYVNSWECNSCKERFTSEIIEADKREWQ